MMHSWQKQSVLGSVIYAYSCLCKGCERKGLAGDAKLAETFRVGSAIYINSCLWKGCERKEETGDAQLEETICIRVGSMIDVYSCL